VVEKGTAVVVERWGRFKRKLEPGLHLLAPFAERPRSMIWRSAETHLNRYGKVEVDYKQEMVTRIDLRENCMDYPFQPVITRDNVEISVHPMLMYKITDPIRAVYETYDLPDCIEKLVQTSLRSIIGDMGLDDALASREEINRQIQRKISQVAFNWGIEITSVDILEIYPTPSIQQAMHQQLAAERIRRAAIVSADGYREQVKTEAEGRSQAAITISRGEQRVAVVRAKARAQSKLMIAEAEASAVSTVAAALKDFAVDATQYLIGLKYIETFLGIASRAGKRVLYFPYDSNFYGAVNSIADPVA